MNKILIIFLLVILFLIALSLWGFYSAIRPFKITSHITPKNYNISYENISFKTKDNITIKGWFIPSKIPSKKVIILLHGYPADKGDILPARIFLHENYNLLFFDFRYLGESSGSYSTVGKNEVLDLVAAINYLHTRGFHQIGVWGFSLGGAVALMTAAEYGNINAIVAEASYARLDWMTYEYYHIPLLRYPLGLLTQFWAWLFLHYNIHSVSPASSAQQLKIPVLLLHSQNDNVVSFKHALLLKESLANNPSAQIYFTHSQVHGETFEDYQQKVSKFFTQNL